MTSAEHPSRHLFGRSPSPRGGCSRGRPPAAGRQGRPPAAVTHSADLSSVWRGGPEICTVLFLGATPSSKPHPPVVGKVTHHSIELYWDVEQRATRRGPQEQWSRFSIEEEDPKMHTYGVIYT